ncbi:hypothetical protein ECE50_026420 [Chitinophaga sp. Mgbs1]|uniref:Uncharacterized protein n=1 Tax=Chitinophaga solisilvae TaxID=1233460 RepID=A0A433WES0_9BACT|nr:hypothetical protein [Chitinophaga solisilvae]
MYLPAQYHTVSVAGRCRETVQQVVANRTIKAVHEKDTILYRRFLRKKNDDVLLKVNNPVSCKDATKGRNTNMIGQYLGSNGCMAALPCYSRPVAVYTVKHIRNFVTGLIGATVLTGREVITGNSSRKSIVPEEEAAGS